MDNSPSPALSPQILIHFYQHSSKSQPLNFSLLKPFLVDKNTNDIVRELQDLGGTFAVMYLLQGMKQIENEC